MELRGDDQGHFLSRSLRQQAIHSRRRGRVILPLPVSLRQKTIGRDLAGLELDGLVKYCSARSRVFARLLSAAQPQSRKADRTGRSTRNKGRSFMMEKAQPGPDAGLSS
jgi:hypothetical protein